MLLKVLMITKKLPVVLILRILRILMKTVKLIMISLPPVLPPLPLVLLLLLPPVSSSGSRDLSKMKLKRLTMFVTNST
jgi:hypothetical protein